MINNPRSNIPDFAALVIWIAASLALAWLAYAGGGMDFNVYYAAARVTLNGGNPYDYSQLAAEIVSVTEINNPYYYLPWFTWSMMPLALLPYQVARGLWSLANLALWFASLFNLQKIVDWPPAGWRRWGMYLFGTLLFAWTTWGFEQVGILIFFLLTLSLLAINKNHWSAGLWLALLLFKPNITAVPVAAIVIWLLARKTWKPSIVLGIATAFMLAVSLIVTPNWFLALLQPDKLTGLSYKFGESGEIEVLRYTTTLKDWLAAYNITGTVANALYASVLLLGSILLLWTALRPTSLVRLTAVALLVNFAVVPYAMYYDYPALTLALFHANDVTFRKPALVWGRAAINIFIMLSLFIGTTISFRYWTLIGIAILLAFRYIAESRMMKSN